MNKKRFRDWWLTRLLQNGAKLDYNNERENDIRAPLPEHFRNLTAIWLKGIGAVDLRRDNQELAKHQPAPVVVPNHHTAEVVEVSPVDVEQPTVRQAAQTERDFQLKMVPAERDADIERQETLKLEIKLQKLKTQEAEAQKEASANALKETELATRAADRLSEQKLAIATSQFGAEMLRTFQHADPAIRAGHIKRLMDEMMAPLIDNIHNNFRQSLELIAQDRVDEIKDPILLTFLATQDANSIRSLKRALKIELALPEYALEDGRQPGLTDFVDMLVDISLAEAAVNPGRKKRIARHIQNSRNALEHTNEQKQAEALTQHRQPPLEGEQKPGLVRVK